MTEEPQAEPATTTLPAAPLLPAPPGNRAGLRGFLGGMAGGAVISLLAAGGLAASWPLVKASLSSGEGARLVALENSVEQLGQKIATLESGQASRGGNTDAAAGAGINQRLGALEAAAANPSTDPRIAALTQKVEQANAEVEALRRAMPPEGLVLRLADRADAAEKVAREIANRHESAQALLLVVGQLRDAVDRGDSYEVELHAARQVAPENEAPILDRLAGTASIGVTRRQSLTDSFPLLASEIVQASVAPAEGAWWQRALNKLAGLVRLRRIDGTGDDTASVVSRAEQRVKAGDLDKALAELSALQGAPAEAAAPWVKAATARVNADRALSQLSATAAAETAKSGG